MLEATLCFLVRGDPPVEVLLGLKKVGFGQGKYGGVGGKIEGEETAVHAAVRELAEETGIRAEEADLRRMAQLTFLFPYRSAWSQIVHVFVANKWTGQARGSREIEPSWCPVTEIPYARMWSDCRYWLPHVLSGRWTQARFTFNADNETIHEMEVKADERM
jgi:8-oxo-dGTP diphosphatase